jgi:DNA-binding NarL/FixJ family response regulator
MQTRRARTVAIADDSPTFVEAASRYVAALPGYAVAGIAHCASEAPALVAACRPDLLLLDLGAAPSRGVELLRRVRALPSAPAIVAMTLFHSAGAAQAAMEAGAAGLVGKDAFVSGLTQILARLFPTEIAA